LTWSCMRCENNYYQESDDGKHVSGCFTEAPKDKVKDPGVERSAEEEQEEGSGTKNSKVIKYNKHRQNVVGWFTYTRCRHAMIKNIFVSFMSSNLRLSTKY
jgi:hypothetical protein